jgi:hypothetical protein
MLIFTKALNIEVIFYEWRMFRKMGLADFSDIAKVWIELRRIADQNASVCFVI